jgi:NADH-quinone oxidoreductase subunit J
VAVVSALAMVLNRNPVHSALFLVLNFFVLAVMYLMLGAEFLAAVQVIVYAGAIMVLFLFVIMLLSVKGEEDLTDRLRGMKPFAVIFALVLLIETAVVLRSEFVTGVKGEYTSEVMNHTSSVELIGAKLFTDYLLPFEVTSVLLLVAIVGAIYMAKRRV